MQKSTAHLYEFCPRCGQQNPQVGNIPFRCPSCSFTNFFSPVTAVGGIVVNEKQEVLFVRRAKDPGKGLWGLPGGFVDRGETAEQAVVREVREEIGLQVLDTSYLCSFPNRYVYQGAESAVLDLFYACRVETLDRIALMDGELDDYLWSQPVESMLDQMAFASNRSAVELWASTTS